MRSDNPPCDENLVFGFFHLSIHSLKVIFSVDIESTWTRVDSGWGKTVERISLRILPLTDNFPEVKEEHQEVENILGVDLKHPVTGIKHKSKCVPGLYLSVLNVKGLIEHDHFLHVEWVFVVSVVDAFIGDCEKFVSPAYEIVHDSTEAWFGVSASGLFSEIFLEVCDDLFWIRWVLLFEGEVQFYKKSCKCLSFAIWVDFEMLVRKAMKSSRMEEA